MIRVLIKALLAIIHTTLICMVIGVFSLSGIHYLYEWINRHGDNKLKDFLDNESTNLK